jgi:hypothetical protein
VQRIDLDRDLTVAVGSDFPDCTTAYTHFRDSYDLHGFKVKVLVPGAVPAFSLTGRIPGQVNASDFEFVGSTNAWNAPAENAITGNGGILVYASSEARFGLAGLTLRNPAGFGVAVGQGEVSVRDCWFGSFGGAALDVCGAKSSITVSGFSTILFEDTGAFAIAEGGDVFINSQVYISGAPGFRNAFVQADLGGYIDLTGYRLALAGAATGVKYRAYSGANIQNNGGVLPGNQTGQINGGFYQ